MKLGSFLYLSSNKEGMRFNTLEENLKYIFCRRVLRLKLVFNNGMWQIFNHKFSALLVDTETNITDNSIMTNPSSA